MSTPMATHDQVSDDSRASSTNTITGNLKLEVPVTIRRITTEQTLSLRHTVLWPDRPIEYVNLEEDERGFHYGAFLLSSPHPLSAPSLTAVDSKGKGEHTKKDDTKCPDSDPVAVISVFLEDLPPEITHLLPSRNTASAPATRPGPQMDDAIATRPRSPDIIATALRFRKFACSPDYQGMGVGSALLHHVFSIARDFHPAVNGIHGRVVLAPSACHSPCERGIAGKSEEPYSGETRKGDVCVVWCDARSETKSWYERRGMREIGERFWKGGGKDDGGVEYVRMLNVL